MREKARVKRPKLQRTRPIRNMSQLLDSGRKAGPAVSEDVAHAVSLGYRVIGEYLEQGRSFARTLTGQERDHRDHSLRAAAPPLDHQNRVLQAAGVLGAALFGAQTQAPAPLRVALDVRTTRAVRARVKVIGAQPLGAAVSLRALQTEDGKGRLRDVSIDSANTEQELAIRIGIPSKQRPGHYRADLVENRSGSTIAQLTVEVLP